MQMLGAIAAIGLYLFGFFTLLQQVKNATVHDNKTFSLIFSAAILAHIITIQYTVFAGQALHLGIINVSSLIFCVIAIISFIAHLRRLEVENLVLLLLPLAAISIAAAQWTPSADKIVTETGLIIHIVLSIIAYSLITLASLQAILLGKQEQQLRSHNFKGIFRYFPPLQTMETLLFDIILGGTVMLTLAIASGFLFLDDMFAQHLVHKTLLSLIAWVLFTVLLWGHHRRGWRGPVAVKWTLIGFMALMLAYFGSKFVLEILLQRP
ncbi:MAG: cytochrome c biogenesis protein CcsA [Pseudomonadales bacterium]|nr:cytochrome c biogenesis protein CcsA [Pseudomonadales bacterium]